MKTKLEKNRKWVWVVTVYDPGEGGTDEAKGNMRTQIVSVHYSEKSANAVWKECMEDDERPNFVEYYIDEAWLITD